MAEWVWEGRTRTGEVRKGVMEADAERDVLIKLRQQNIQPSRVKKKGRGINLPSFGGSVGAAELVVFVRQFATMIDAGLPLVQCLDILGTQEPNKTFKKVILDVKASVEGGATFADSLKRHPAVFDNLFVNLVAAGEIGGILDTILNRLATYIEKNVKLVRQVKGAMTYPIGILVVAIGVVAALLKYVIPTFEKMFADMGGAKLPAITQFVIGASHWFQEYFLFIVVGSVAFIWFARRFYRSARGRDIVDTVLLRMPIFGPLSAQGRGRQVHPHARHHDRVGRAHSRRARDRREVGGQYGDRAGDLLRPRQDQRGQQHGRAPRQDQRVPVDGRADDRRRREHRRHGHHAPEDRRLLRRRGRGGRRTSLTKLLEPLMMVFIGGIVGTVLIAMYMPIFEVAGNVKT
jgi:type IV pilus assembly protein PilC